MYMLNGLVWCIFAIPCGYDSFRQRGGGLPPDPLPPPLKQRLGDPPPCAVAPPHPQDGDANKDDPPPPSVHLSIHTCAVRILWVMMVTTRNPAPSPQAMFAHDDHPEALVAVLSKMCDCDPRFLPGASDTDPISAILVQSSTAKSRSILEASKSSFGARSLILTMSFTPLLATVLDYVFEWGTARRG